MKYQNASFLSSWTVSLSNWFIKKCSTVSTLWFLRRKIPPPWPNTKEKVVHIGLNPKTFCHWVPIEISVPICSLNCLKAKMTNHCCAYLRKRHLSHFKILGKNLDPWLWVIENYWKWFRILLFTMKIQNHGRLLRILIQHRQKSPKIGQILNRLKRGQKWPKLILVDLRQP